MKKIGRFVFMGEAEYVELSAAVRTSDKQFQCGYREGFNAGKWHSAGGYGKALKAVRAKLQETETLLSATASQRFEMQRLLEKWQPLVEALETTKGQLTEMS